MRTLLKVSIDAASGNKAFADGTFVKTLQSTLDTLKPEASYFFSENGCRAAFIVFDLKDTSEIPRILEPLFMGMGAKLDLIPVMNGDDLQKGLGSMQQ